MDEIVEICCLLAVVDYDAEAELKSGLLFSARTLLVKSPDLKLCGTAFLAFKVTLCCSGYLLTVLVYWFCLWTPIIDFDFFAKRFS